MICRAVLLRSMWTGNRLLFTEIVMVKENKSETPRCEYKGCLPHRAEPAYLLVWSLPSGPVVKWSCADHRFSFGGNRRPVVAKVECFEEDKHSCTHCYSGEGTVQATCVDPECGNPAPYKGARCHSCQSRWEVEQRDKAAATAARGCPKNTETAPAQTGDTCIRCCKTPALAPPLGCGGQLCQSCVDLQNAEYVDWVRRERLLGNIPFGNGEPETRLVR